MINSVSLVGRLTKDPELRYTPKGIAVTRFTLAVNRPFTGQNNEKQADFINVLVWRKAAENAANYLHKGSLTGVVGRIQTGSYEGQDGKRVYTTEVVAEQVQFLDSNSQHGNSQQNRTQQNSQQQKPTYDKPKPPPDLPQSVSRYEPAPFDVDDDLPF